MRGYFITGIVVWLGISATYAQELKRIDTKDKPVICYARHDNCASHVKPPQEFINGRNASIQNADIVVTYDENFPVNAKTAFEYAVSIWETLISSPVQIKIEAHWSTLGSGVLGSAIYWSAFANFDGAQKLNVFYPVALAEKIAGEELNDPDEFEIFANFSSGINWYFGTDGLPASNQFDFVTVVLHEIGHGLGFSSSFDVVSTQGQVGAFETEVPIIFDIPVENASGVKLVQGFASPSSSLKTQLISNNLKIKVLKNSLGEARLYAPSTFDGGSSISHLNENTYSSNDPNSNALMTPEIGFQEANHNPGPLAFGILSDLGWEIVSVEHQPHPNTETEVGPYTISAKLTNDGSILYDASDVKLNYTSDGSNFTTVAMIDQGNDEFSAVIPTAPSIPWTYAYYISVGDNADRTVLHPGKLVQVGQAEVQDLHVFEIGPDTKHPKIVHVPEPYLKESETQIEIRATVSDNIGIESVTVEISVNNGGIIVQQLSLTAPEEDSVYTALINLGTLAKGDIIKYTITAIDNSLNPKSTISPSSGFHTVEVIGFNEPVDFYENNFSVASNDFFGSGFSVATPSGFSNPAIHTTHPYLEGDAFPNDELELFYILKSPIVVSADNPIMSFDEIVLVEPGEAGSVFGDDDFWDYVIVEGSLDFGETWTPLLDGYDSRRTSEWLTKYNSSIAGNNSNATGNPDLFLRRHINISNTFNPTDEIVIRFRLYSDQLARGWGWAIDNLTIQGPVTSIEKQLESAISVYPNPARENLMIEANGLSLPFVNIQLINVQGQTVYSANAESVNGKLFHSISSTSMQQGLYLIKISSTEETITRKVLKN